MERSLSSKVKFLLQSPVGVFAGNVLRRQVIHLDSTGKPTPPVIDQSDTEDISDIDDNSLDGERDHNENAICGECTILYGYVVTLSRGPQVASAKKNLPVRWEIYSNELDRY